MSAPTSLKSIPETAVSIADEGSFDPAAGIERQAIAASECGTRRAVRCDRYKYVVSDGERTLFDLETDPGEETDIAAAFPDLSRRLDRQLKRRDHHITESDKVHRTTKQLVAAHSL